MERMTKVDENIQTAQNLLSGIIERCYELEEENKKLKEENDKFYKTIQTLSADNQRFRARLDMLGEKE